MADDIDKILLNPIRMRIIQSLASRQSITASELCEIMDDIPRTTMYRHIRLLIDKEILSVISEKKIRGSLERTIALNLAEITKHNTLENAAQNAFGFLMTNYTKFQSYFSGENADPEKDKIFLNNTVMMMSDTEFDSFLSGLRELLIRYSFDAEKGRKARDISIISAPVEKE